MNYLHSNGAVRVTHVPTGIDATVEVAGTFRSMHRAKDMAVKILKARLWAKANLLEKTREVAVYELPDDVYFPHDLSDFRSEAGGEG